MRIHQDNTDGVVKFYFSRARNFETLYELVQYFHLNPLSEAFQE